MQARPRFESAAWFQKFNLNDEKSSFNLNQVCLSLRRYNKVNAMATALRRAFPSVEFDVRGVDAPSGVRDQPIGDAETLKVRRCCFTRVDISLNALVC